MDNNTKFLTSHRPEIDREWFLRLSKVAHKTKIAPIRRFFSARLISIQSLRVSPLLDSYLVFAQGWPDNEKFESHFQTFESSSIFSRMHQFCRIICAKVKV